MWFNLEYKLQKNVEMPLLSNQFEFITMKVSSTIHISLGEMRAFWGTWQLPIHKYKNEEITNYITTKIAILANLAVLKVQSYEFVLTN